MLDTTKGDENPFAVNARFHEVQIKSLLFNFRFAHGAFLHCIESLYHKITGYELKYTALVGKPSELTYVHSENVLQEQAKEMGLPGIHRMYCIG